MGNGSVWPQLKMDRPPWYAVHLPGPSQSTVLIVASVSFLSTFHSTIMPFRRTRRTRRRRTRRRPTALRAVRRLARFVDTELHQVTVTNALVSVEAVALFFPIILVDQGDDDNQRNGVQISCRSVSMKFLAERGNTDACMRVILMIDRQVNGVVPDIADLLEVSGNPPLQLTSPFNNDFTRRFTILSDTFKTFIDGHSDQRCWSLKRRLTHKVRYDRAGALIDDVVSGMLYVVLFQANAGAAAGITTTFLSRVRFAP